MLRPPSGGDKWSVGRYEAEFPSASDRKQNAPAASGSRQQRTIARTTSEIWRVSPHTWSHVLCWCNFQGKHLEGIPSKIVSWIIPL